MLMEPIILVVIKLMGAAISGHWDLGDTGTTRDYDTLARSLGWLSGSGPGWQSHKNVTFSPVGHAWLPIWLRPVTAKRVNNQGGNVHIFNSTSPIVLILVSRDSCGIALCLYVRLIVGLFFPNSSFQLVNTDF